MKRIFFNAGIRNQSLGRAYRYDEELVVPIIENTPFEEDLKDRMTEIIQSYPESSAVLVRRHGIYVWGDTWQQAKTMLDFLIKIIYYHIKNRLIK